MKIKNLLKILGILVIPTAVNAQISNGALKGFSPSVVVKVYNVAVTTPLSAQKQLALANLYKQQDSILSKNILTGASATEIEAINNGFDAKLSMVLNPQEIKTYYINRLKINNKANATNKNFVEARAALFISNKLMTLDSIRPLDQNTKDQMTQQFMNKAAKTGTPNFANIFKHVLQQAKLDTIYVANYYKDQINNNASNAVRVALRRGKITGRDTAVIYQQKKQLGTILHSRGYGRDRDTLTNHVKTRYQPVIDSVKIIAGTETIKSYINYAITHSQQLNLSSGQKQLLAKELIQIKQKRSNKKNGISTGNFESEKIFLGKVLSKEQIRLYETLKDQPNAERWAINKWKSIKDKHLAPLKDSATTIAAITNYRLTTMVQNALTRGYGKPITDSNTTKPEKPIVLRKLDVAVKTGIAENKSQFKW